MCDAIAKVFSRTTRVRNKHPTHTTRQTSKRAVTTSYLLDVRIINFNSAQKWETKLTFPYFTLKPTLERNKNELILR